MFVFQTSLNSCVSMTPSSTSLPFSLPFSYCPCRPPLTIIEEVSFVLPLHQAMRSVDVMLSVSSVSPAFFCLFIFFSSPALSLISIPADNSLHSPCTLTFKVFRTHGPEKQTLLATQTQFNISASEGFKKHFFLVLCFLICCGKSECCVVTAVQILRKKSCRWSSESGRLWLVDCGVSEEKIFLAATHWFYLNARVKGELLDKGENDRHSKHNTTESQLMVFALEFHPQLN